MVTEPKKQEPEEESEAVILERMNDALKRAMNTKPETHGEMVRRRRSKQTSNASQNAKGEK
jgi:hypothetical protein